MSTGGEITQESIDLITAHNKLLQENNRLLSERNTMLGKQAGVSQAATEANKQATQSETEKKDAVKAATEALREQADGAEGLANALGRQSKATADSTKNTEDNINAMAKMIENFGLLNIAMAASQEALNATKLVFTTGLDLMTSGFGMLQSAVGLVISPLQGLMKAAADYRNKHAGAAFQANQELVRSFGDLNGETGKFVKSMKKDLMGAAGNLTKAGNSMWAAIGHGYDVLKEVTKMAGEFGDQFIRLKGQIAGAADEMFLMGRGMGMSGESMKMMAINAEAAGGSLEDSLREGMVASAHLANQFGVDVKQIGKNMDKMQKDMATFGHMAPKELAAVATYATKLGVSIESLKGTMDAFDTFESAAQNAGKLAEAFGMNIDVMAMMNAENPAERMDMLRKSFEETGKSVNDLSRHELKMLSESMGGIPIDELKASLSMSTDEMGFGDMADAANEAAEKMTPEQAMDKVAKSIDKLNNAIIGLEGGPLKDFIKGFEKGLTRSKEFKAILKDIGDWLQLFQDAGKRIGDLFAKTFMKEGTKFHKLLHNIFNLDKAKAFLDTIEKVFGALFSGLSKGEDPGKLAGTFFDDLMKAFKDWIGLTGESGIGDLLKDMLTGAIKFVGGLAPKIIKEASKYIVQFAEGLKDFLESDDKVNSTVGGGVAGALVEAFNSIKDSLINDLLPALLDLFGVLFEKFGPIVIPLLAGVYTVIFVKSLVAGMLQAAASTMLQAGALTLSKKLAKIMDKSSSKQQKVDKKSNKALKEVSKDLGGKDGMIRNIAKINKGDIKAAGKNLLRMAAYMIAGMIAFATGLFAVSAILGMLSWNQLGKGIIGLTAAVMASIPMIAGAYLISKNVKGKGEWKKLGIAMLGMAALFAGGGVLFAGALALIAWAFSKVDMMGALKALGMIAIASMVAIPMIGAVIGISYVPGADDPKKWLEWAAMMVGMAALFTVGGSALGVGLTVMVPFWSGVDYGAALKAVGMIGFISLAMLPMIATTAILGLMINKLGGMKLVGSMAIAFAVIVGILAASVYALPWALNKLVDNFGEINFTQAMKCLALMSAMILAIIPMLFVAALLGAAVMIAASLGGVAGVALLIVAIAAGFGLTVAIIAALAEIAPTLGKSIRAIVSGLNIQNPDKVLTVIQIVGELMGIIATLGKLAAMSGEMKKAKKLVKKGGEGREVTNTMSDFITSSIGAIKSLVVALVDASKAMRDEKTQKGALVVAKLIGAVANLASTLQEPMMAIQKRASWWTSNKKLAQTMNKVATMMGNLFRVITSQIIRLVRQVVKIFTKLTPEESKLLTKHAPILEALFNGIGAVAGTFESLNNAQKVKGSLGALDINAINENFVTMAAIMGGDAFFGVIQAFGKIGPKTQGVDVKGLEEAYKKFRDIKNSMFGFIKIMLRFDNQIFTTVNKKALASVYEFLLGAQSGKNSPAKIVEMIGDEANKLAISMSALESDFGDVALKPLIDGVLGYEGDRTFTIKPETVNIQMKLSVKLDAKELATEIAKGNKDSGGFFVLTEEAANMKTEGGGLLGSFLGGLGIG